MKNRTLQDIWNLSRGLATQGKIGSRGVPHRLTRDERRRIHIALRKGYLELQMPHRTNPIHIYEKLCHAKGRDCIYVEHNRNESFVYKNHVHVFTTQDRKEAKRYAEYVSQERKIDPV